jgi:hypothetical protein
MGYDEMGYEKRCLWTGPNFWLEATLADQGQTNSSSR